MDRQTAFSAKLLVQPHLLFSRDRLVDIQTKDVQVPGIVGIITQKPEAIVREQIVPMLKAIKHESFYESGQWADASLGVYVGWSSLKGSFSSEMPVVDQGNDVVLIFSGQEYSDPQER